MLRLSLKQGGYLRLTSPSISEEMPSPAVKRSLPSTRSGVKMRPEPPSRRSSIDESVVRFLVSKTSALCSSWASGLSSFTRTGPEGPTASHSAGNPLHGDPPAKAERTTRVLRSVRRRSRSNTLPEGRASKRTLRLAMNRV